MEMVAKKKYGIIGLLISLLFHYFIAAYIFLKQATRDTLKQETEWIETHSRLQQGAPIFFVNNDTAKMDAASQKESSTQQPLTTQKKENFIVQPSPIPLPSRLPGTSQSSPSFRSQTPYKNSCNPIRQSPNSPLRKQLPSLSQLAQGIMNYVKEEGQYKVSMAGKKTGIPSDDQLKYERYLERLNGCLHNAFTIMRDKAPSNNAHYKIHIFLALNANGSLHNLRLEKSSGIQNIDIFILSVFRYASSSFPPVPQYLPHNPFSITYIFDIGN